MGGRLALHRVGGGASVGVPRVRELLPQQLLSPFAKVRPESIEHARVSHDSESPGARARPRKKSSNDDRDDAEARIECCSAIRW